MNISVLSTKTLVIFATILWLSFVCACNNPTESEVGLLGESYLHIRPSWSTDGKSVAFTARIENVQGIYLVDSSGSNIRVLIEGEGIGTTWSPDGEWLAFSRIGSIYKIKDSGDSLTRLTTSTIDIRPAWSRDGRKLAFVRTGIWLYDFGTDNLRELSSFGNYPSWDPNNTEIVVLEAQLDAAANAIVYRFSSIHSVTNAVRTIHTFTSGSDCAFASISPNGNAIAYSLKPANDYAQVWKFDLSGAGHTRLTDDGGDFPAWSPDGSRIVYTRTQTGDGGLWIMNADGTGKRRLTTP